MSKEEDVELMFLRYADGLKSDKPKLAREYALEVIKLFSPPPVAGDLREKIARVIYDEAHKPAFNNPRAYVGIADSIFALLDIDNYVTDHRGRFNTPQAGQAEKV